MLRPNILFLMADQMQGRVLEPGHACQTPHLDRLAGRGVRFQRAYTPNAICSPARASLMTGLLPHNHGVLTVTHCVDQDQSCLRDVPHWAQRLQQAGYRTGYFGKWHVERSGQLERFGWQTYADPQHSPPGKLSSAFHLDTPGYRPTLLYGVTDQPPEQRYMGRATNLALRFLDSALQGDSPWCCFVSVTEPHDPFVCGQKAYQQYDPATLSLPSNATDPMADKPGLYRKMARVFSNMTDEQKRQAMAYYYALVSEIDGQFGRLLSRLEHSGQLDNTLVVVTADHGELLGAHGLYTKNVGAFQEVYNIPMLLAGPGLARNRTSNALVGLHDLAPTLLELASLEPLDGTDSRSFLPAAQNPATDAQFDIGYAEFHGTRYLLSQRLLWNGNWKLVHNGFDEDELYNLAADPCECHNLAQDLQHQARLDQLLSLMWQRLEQTGDRTLLNTHYPSMRLAPRGPLASPG